MPRRTPTQGFTDTAKTAQPGAQRGAPAFGSPAAGIIRRQDVFDGLSQDAVDFFNTGSTPASTPDSTSQDGFDWLDALSGIAENETVVNAIKGLGGSKPAAAIQKPASKPTALGGLNPTILYVGAGIVVLIVAAMFFKK